MNCIRCGKEGATHEIARKGVSTWYHRTAECYPGLTSEEYNAHLEDPVKRENLLNLLLHLRDKFLNEYGMKGHIS